MIAPPPRPISEVRLDGGRLCIDFANTIHDRFAVEAEDYLATPERYAGWAERTGAISADEAVRLPRSEAARARLVADIRGLREAVFHLLAAWCDGIPLPADALRTANLWLLEARKAQALTGDGQLLLSAGQGDVVAPLKRIALDLVCTFAKARAGELRLERCANHHSCGWLFADTSKNRRRRWCSMQTCGVASKMARLRQKSSLESDTS
jgi:predicted RNA-binding Zn ribbon-like protein